MSLQEVIRHVVPETETRAHNLVTTAGKRLNARLLMAEQLAGIVYIAFGSGSTVPSVGDTQLTAEAARKIIADKVLVGNVITFSAYFLASECAYAIQEVGFFADYATDALNSGVLYSRVLKSYDNSAGGSDLTFQYTLTVS
jgi:hypothetical protein